MPPSLNSPGQRCPNFLPHNWRSPPDVRRQERAPLSAHRAQKCSKICPISPKKKIMCPVNQEKRCYNASFLKQRAEEALLLTPPSYLLPARLTPPSKRFPQNSLSRRGSAQPAKPEQLRLRSRGQARGSGALLRHAGAPCMYVD